MTDALRERLVRETGHDPDTERWLQEIREMQREVAQLPVYDERPPDEIIGYDENGLPSRPLPVRLSTGIR